MFETFKKARRCDRGKASRENRLATLRRVLADDAPVLAGSAEHARLMADGKLAGRVAISPDEPVPPEPISWRTLTFLPSATSSSARRAWGDFGRRRYAGFSGFGVRDGGAGACQLYSSRRRRHHSADLDAADAVRAGLIGDAGKVLAKSLEFLLCSLCGWRLSLEQEQPPTRPRNIQGFIRSLASQRGANRL